MNLCWKEHVSRNITFMKSQSLSSYSGIAIACHVVLSVSEFHETPMFTCEKNKENVYFDRCEAPEAKNHKHLMLSSQLPKVIMTDQWEQRHGRAPSSRALRILKGTQSVEVVVERDLDLFKWKDKYLPFPKIVGFS